MRYSQSLGSESSGAHMKPARLMPPAIGGRIARLGEGIRRATSGSGRKPRRHGRDMGGEPRSHSLCLCSRLSQTAAHRASRRTMPRPRRLNQDCSLLDEIPQDRGDAEDPEGKRNGSRRPVTATAISAPTGHPVPPVRAVGIPRDGASSIRQCLVQHLRQTRIVGGHIGGKAGNDPTVAANHELLEIP